MPSTTSEEGKSAAPKFQAPKKGRKWLRKVITAVVVALVVIFLLRVITTHTTSSKPLPPKDSYI